MPSARTSPVELGHSAPAAAAARVEPRQRRRAPRHHELGASSPSRAALTATVNERGPAAAAGAVQRTRACGLHLVNALLKCADGASQVTRSPSRVAPPATISTPRMGHRALLAAGDEQRRAAATASRPLRWPRCTVVGERPVHAANRPVRRGRARAEQVLPPRRRRPRRLRSARPRKRRAPTLGAMRPSTKTSTRSPRARAGCAARVKAAAGRLERRLERRPVERRRSVYFQSSSRAAGQCGQARRLQRAAWLRGRRAARS